MNNRMKALGPIALMLAIFGLSSIPMDGGPDHIAFLTDLNPDLQNMLHIPLYGALAFLWMRFFAGTGRAFGPAGAWTLLITMGYGVLDEVHQSFVPGRYGGLMDILLNGMGAALGVWAYSLMVRLRAGMGNS